MTIPEHTQAEEALIGAMMLSSVAVNDAVAHVAADEFIGERTRQVFEAIVALWLGGEPVDVITVCERLKRERVQITPYELTVYVNNTPDARAAAKYARIIADHATMRRLMFLGDNLRHRAEALPDDPYELAREAIADLQSIGSPIQQLEPGPDLDTFLAQDDGGADMIVPDYLERTDRIVLTGGEGRGKARPSDKEGSRWPRASCPTRTRHPAHLAEYCSSTARTPRGSYGGNSLLSALKPARGSTRNGSRSCHTTAGWTCLADATGAGSSRSSSRTDLTW